MLQCVCGMVFFFKQKTAYEMRISDWSSDVCSSDLFDGERGDYGIPLNPHDPTRVPGGSSSGSAVAVAAGEVDIAFGGDQGGSIRMPAAWCGILGLKPTFGLISHFGIGFGYEHPIDFRSEERRGGKECVSTCRF